MADLTGDVKSLALLGGPYQGQYLMTKERRMVGDIVSIRTGHGWAHVYQVFRGGTAEYLHSAMLEQLAGDRTFDEEEDLHLMEPGRWTR